MLTFEYIAPAVQRLMDLCTNGLFLNLRNFPEPLKSSYQHLRDAVRTGRYAGACLALADMAALCLRFPALSACAIAYHMEAPVEDKQKIYRSLTVQPLEPGYCMNTLLGVLKEFFLHHPDETAHLFLTAMEDAERTIRQHELWDWCLRDSAGAFLEMNRPEAASELITQIEILNQYLRQVQRFYEHVRELPGTEELVYDCLGHSFSPEPLIRKVHGNIYLTELFDASSRQFVCRNQNTMQIELFSAPEDFISLQEEGEPDPDSARLTRMLSGAYQAGDYVRPAYLDRFVAQSLSERSGGYILLEAESGMGKSVYASMLDSRSPYYSPSQYFEDVQICRYGISVYPDTQRPSYFVRFLNRTLDRPDLEPSQRPRSILFTESVPDLRRRIACFLNEHAELSGRKLLLVLDGMHHLDYDSADGLTLPQILPYASQLSSGVYILLTDRCALNGADSDMPVPGARHRAWLLEKDPLACIGTFTRQNPQHQQLFRIYLTQYVLHASSEDNPLVASISGQMKGDLSLAHTFRDVLALCRPDPQTNLAAFFAEYQTQPKLLSLYLARLHELYGPVYSGLIDELLQLFALSPHPLSLPDLEELIADRPGEAVLWPILRDLRPFLTLMDFGSVGIATSKIHFSTLSRFSPQWKDYCVRLLRQREQLLCASPYPLTRHNLLTDLDYYAAGAGWFQHEELLSHLAQCLLPPKNRTEALPQPAVDFYHVLGGFFSDETANPFRLSSLSVFSLSPVLSDRRMACGRWESLRGTPQFDASSYARSCRLYISLLSRQNPLCASTIEALVSFRRKTETLYEYSFLWHTERLTRVRLFEALKNPSQEQPVEDPCSLDHVRRVLEDLTATAEDDLNNPLPQECAVLTHLLMPFCETYLRALLPVLCIRDVLPEARELFSFMQNMLNRVYSCRRRLSRCIREYSALLLTDAVCRDPLYNQDPGARSLEDTRQKLLKKDLRLWLQTFTEHQRLQFFRDHTPLWRTEEAVLRLESAAAPAARDFAVNPRTIRAQIQQLLAGNKPAEALEKADSWYGYLKASLTSGKGAINISHSNELCDVQLVRADLLCRLDMTEELHSCVSQLRFFLEYGALSSRRSLELICALGSRLLAADTLARYSSAQSLVALYASLNSRLQKSRSFLTGRQIAAVQEQLRQSFPQCMLSQQFYAYLIPAQARIDAVEYGLEGCRERTASQDPVTALTAYLAVLQCTSDKESAREALLAWLENQLRTQQEFMPGALVDYCTSLALDQLREAGHSAWTPASFAAPFYNLWKRCFRTASLPSEFALLGLDGQAPSDLPAIYRRTSGCFFTEGSPLDPETLRDEILSQDKDPEHQAFFLLCTAIAAGSRSISAAGTLAQMGMERIECGAQVTVQLIPLALELVKVRLLALCLDEKACPNLLEAITAQWIDLLWARAIALENCLPPESRIVRTEQGYFTAVPPVALTIGNQILEDCIGSDAVVSTPFLGPAFRLYSRLWNTPFACPVPEQLPELLRKRLMENWHQLDSPEASEKTT